MENNSTELSRFEPRPDWYDRMLSILVIFGIALCIIWSAIFSFGIIRLVEYLSAWS